MYRNRGGNKKVIYLRPKKRSFKPLSIVVIVLSLAVLVLLIKYFNKGTYILKEGNIHQSFVSDAVVIRQEKLVNSPVEGELDVLVKSGERVRVNTPIFKVIRDTKKQKEYQNEIREVEDKIKAIKNENNQNKTQSVLDKSIEDMTIKLQDAISKGELKKADNIKSELIRLKEEKSKKYKVREKNIKAMYESLQDLKNKLQEIEYIVYAPMSGVVSFSIDGMEKLLSPSNIQNITYDEIKNTDIANNIIDINKSNSVVSCNQPVLKIIDNFSYYLVLPIKEGEKLQEGKNYDIVFTSFDKATKGKLVRIADKSLGVFRLNTDIEELSSNRKLEVEVLTGNFYGKMVPVDSLVISEGREGVYLIQRSNKVFKPVKVIVKNDKYAIVEGLKIGDKILLN